MAKRIVNKAERNAERYSAKEVGYKLYADSKADKVFDRLMPPNSGRPKYTASIPQHL